MIVKEFFSLSHSMGDVSQGRFFFYMKFNHDNDVSRVIIVITFTLSVLLIFSPSITHMCCEHMKEILYFLVKKRAFGSQRFSHESKKVSFLIFFV
jgi:hypothetical protein